MSELLYKRFLKLIVVFFAIGYLSVGLAQTKKVQQVEEVTRLLNSGQCDAAESSARNNFSNETTVYVLLGIIENDCRRNRRSAVEYFKLGARQGDNIAADMLIKMGETPPAPREVQRTEDTRAKQSCLDNAREPMCYFGCIGERVNGMACNHKCRAREQANVAACNGVFYPPAQQIIIQGGDDQTPFSNMNKCIQDGGSLMCLNR